LLLGISKWNFYNFLFLLLYSVLSVSYNLWLYSKLVLGTFKMFDNLNFVLDLSRLEIAVLLPLIILNFGLCFFSNLLTSFITPFFFSIL
jgi:NADH:ubiquinone oxidoreductase subunit 4 (subunit M)